MTSLDRLLFILKILCAYATKRATLMTKSNVQSLPLQLVFPGVSNFNRLHPYNFKSYTIPNKIVRENTLAYSAMVAVKSPWRHSIQHNDTQHNYTTHNAHGYRVSYFYCCAECRFCECFSTVFITLKPGPIIIKFSSVCNKLECLSLAALFQSSLMFASGV